jgi:hypothetical protein
LGIHDNQSEEILNRPKACLVETLMESTILPNLVQTPDLIIQCWWIVLLVHCIHKDHKNKKDTFDIRTVETNRSSN